ncbi:RraA family protein [Nocardioides sp. NPDC057577]|uniref:RraA family protein n=1 Tax=Nocardioides sp. NPDC057577 TaxID=3346171 RepID=UPI0036716BB8
MSTAVQPTAAFDRCDPADLSRLATHGAALVADAMDRFGALDSAISQQWADARLVGNAFPVWTRAGDNLAIHDALEVIAPGDVLVVNGASDAQRALIGEMIGIKAKARGLAGFVLDGAARDIDDLAALQMPVFARAASPAGPYKFGPYRMLEPVAVGGVCVHPGDAVLADRDGVVVVPRLKLEAVLEKAAEIEALEAGKRITNARPIR